MSARTFVLFTSIVLSSAASIACGDDAAEPSGTGGTPGSGGSSSGGSSSGGGNGDKCEVKVNPSAAPVSFKDNVMPIFGFACAGSSCHSGSRPKAELFLGPKCEFDSATKGCNYPTTADPSKPEGPQPLTAEDLNKVYADLMENSVTAPAVKRIAANDPDASFLIDKVAGIHNDKNLTCQNTETNAEVGPCGQYMPYTGGPLCKTGSTGPARVETIVNWVAQGAKKE